MWRRGAPADFYHAVRERPVIQGTDAGAFADVLKQHAKTKLGVLHRVATVEQVLLTDDGQIAALKLNDAATPVSADELTRNAVPIREQVARASTGNVYWMFLLEGATRDPRVTAAALSMQDDIAAVTAADVQRLARQYLTPQRQWSLAILPKGMTLADASALGAATAAPSAGGR